MRTFFIHLRVCLAFHAPLSKQNAQIAWPAFKRNIKTTAVLFYIQCEGSVVSKPRGVRRPNCGPPNSMPHSFLFAANRFLLLEAAAVCRPLFYGRVYGPAFASQRAPVSGPNLVSFRSECATRRIHRRMGEPPASRSLSSPAPYYYDLAQLSAKASVINSFLMMSFHYVRGKSFLPLPCLDAVVFFYLGEVFLFSLLVIL